MEIVWKSPDGHYKKNPPMSKKLEDGTIVTGPMAHEGWVQVTVQEKEIEIPRDSFQVEAAIRAISEKYLTEEELEQESPILLFSALSSILRNPSTPQTEVNAVVADTLELLFYQSFLQGFTMPEDYLKPTETGTVIEEVDTP